MTSTDPALTRPLAGRLYALLLAGLGLILLWGGIKLAAVGGSWWYACAGALLLASAALLWCGHRVGAWVYGVLLAGTVVWGLQESGLNGWALAPRWGLLLVLGLWFLTPMGQRGLFRGPGPLLAGWRIWGFAMRSWAWALIALAAVTLCIAVARLWQGAASSSGTSTSITPVVVASQAATADWSSYGGEGGRHYSPLTQIGRANVAGLVPVWQFRTGDMDVPGAEYDFEATPLMVNGLLYLCSPGGKVFALDAATGKLQWQFDPKPELAGVRFFACRGVSYFKMGSSAAAVGADGFARAADVGGTAGAEAARGMSGDSGPCRERIYEATVDDRLWALDARTGRPCEDFGGQGFIDLLDGLGAVVKGQYSVTSPPLVTHGRIVVGARVQDNVSVDMPSGVVRAYDAMTGRLVWAWDVGQPDRGGAPAAGDTYTRSTPNVWAPMVADDARGLIYLPTGNPAADFWGQRRRPFDERFGSALVAVDVDTGRTRWRFQLTHHDVWDNDLAHQPLLMDVPSARGMEPAIAVGSKQGDIFVLDRVTGEPIVPVNEVPVPGDSNIGESLAATQPHSALRVNPGPSRLSETYMWGITPVDQMWCRIQFRRARYEGPYTPPGTGPATLAYPGMFGGVEWGGLAVDPVHGILVVNPDAMPFMVRMARVAAGATDPGMSEMRGTGFAVSYFPFLSPLRVPCLEPPWGKLYAIDLATRKVLWQRPVGTMRDSGPLGLASHVPLLMGTPQVGGTLVTGGGLIFAAATLDRYLRAYDLHSGEQLWEARLPAGGQATPMTYEVAGRQFVVIAAGGHAVLGTTRGDYVVAYALNNPARTSR